MKNFHFFVAADVRRLKLIADCRLPIADLV